MEGNEYFCPMKHKLCIVAFTLLAFTSGSSAQVATLDFTGGNGTSSVDQWQGTGGSGWTAGWVQGTDSSSMDINRTVVNTDPFFGGGGNYLSGSNTVLATYGGQVRNGIYRAYNGATLTDSLTYSWNFRIDSATGFSNAFNDQLTFMETSDQQVFNPGSAATTTWFLQLRGAAGNLTVRARNGTGQVDTASAIAIGTDYGFQVVSNPTTKTYSYSITNLATSGVVASGTNLGWWNGSASAHGGVFNTIVGLEGNNIGDGVAFSLDSVAISAIPEPSTYALLGLGLGALVWLRRRAGS